MRRRRSVYVVSFLAAVATCGCKPAVVVLQNKEVRTAALTVATNVATDVLKRLFDGISSTAKAEPRLDATASASALAAQEASRQREEAQRQAQVERLAKVYLEKAAADMLAQQHAALDANAALTFTCLSGETEFDCLDRLKKGLLNTVSGRADALEGAFKKCQQQVALDRPDALNILQMVDALDECVAAQGFRDEVVALDPSYEQGHRS